MFCEFKTNGTGHTGPSSPASTKKLQTLLWDSSCVVVLDSGMLPSDQIANPFCTVYSNYLQGARLCPRQSKDYLAQAY